MNLSKSLSFIGVLYLFSHFCVAADFLPVRTLSEISTSGSTESVLRVQTAKIALVDYRLVRKDFPYTDTWTDHEIDQWIIDRTSFISKSQASQSLANTPIQIGQDSRVAYRPPSYGRGLVFEMGVSGTEDGLMDAKGTGAISAPTLDGHRNGVATLGESIREFLYEKLVAKIMAHEGQEFKTVGTYAVVSFGFDVNHQDGSKSPAGYVLRQAHKRDGAFGSLWDEENLLKAEKILRRYGITSAGAYRDQYSFDKINIQGTENHRAIVDFGGFLTLEDFGSRRGKHFYQNKDLIIPGTANWVDPLADLRIPSSLWGVSVSGIEDPKLDNPWIWSHELARDFSAGRANRDDVWSHFQNLLEPVEKNLASMSTPNSGLTCAELLRRMLR